MVDDPRIGKYIIEDDVIAFPRTTGTLATIARTRSRFKVVEEDPSADIVLRAAHDGRAEYIVSGDRHLLTLREFRKIKMVTVSQMLDILERAEGEHRRQIDGT